MNSYVMTREEKISYRLRSLYRSYGYSRYKMSKFEEYDLYVRNKSFLVSDHIITFTDHTGQLLALKPDVTLSIVKNGRDVAGQVERIYYNEKVYRTAAPARDFREIDQVGLECIGALDDYCVGEVLTLAAKSLAEAGRYVKEELSESDCVLEIAHLDIVARMLESAGVGADAEALLNCIGEKNAHDLARMCAERGVPAEQSEALLRLVNTYGAPDEVLAVLDELAQRDAGLVAPVEELRRTLLAVPASVRPILRLDFSLVSDMTYYNGIVFRGYVKGMPDAVLSGGRYDKLMRKLGRRSDAIGFAVYLDRLVCYASSTDEFCFDSVVWYDDTTDVGELSETVAACAELGERVVALRAPADNVLFKRQIDMRNKEGK